MYVCAVMCVVTVRRLICRNSMAPNVCSHWQVLWEKNAYDKVRNAYGKQAMPLGVESPLLQGGTQNEGEGSVERVCETCDGCGIMHSLVPVHM